MCRYGGEEFMVVAPGTGLNDAVKLGERLRCMIDTTTIRYETQKRIVVTWQPKASRNHPYGLCPYTDLN